MFYKALGFVVWRLALAYLRERYARPAKVVLAAGVISAGVAAYLATRSAE